jgi:hypothetical protein
MTLQGGFLATLMKLSGLRGSTADKPNLDSSDSGGGGTTARIADDLDGTCLQLQPQKGRP